MHKKASQFIQISELTIIFFLPLQRLCDYVCDLLLEESNVQPVSSPVTVCGDIHGQVTTPKYYILIIAQLLLM